MNINREIIELLNYADQHPKRREIISNGLSYIYSKEIKRLIKINIATINDQNLTASIYKSRVR